MLAKNSSGVAFSAPDHFGTRDISDKSLCTVCIPLDICFLSFSISALDSAISCLNFAAAIAKLYSSVTKI